MTEVSFGEWLKRQRMGRGLTREQLAHQIGCAVITLRKIEAEERHPSVQIVERLAEILNIPQDQNTAFLRFARGDWVSVPTGITDDFPWLTSPVSEPKADDGFQPTVHLATFLFTDIEGSAKLWDQTPEKMKVALQRHHEILQEAITMNGGSVFQIVGDAFCAAFPTTLSAVSAAVTAQRELYQEAWDLPFPIRVRMGIHTGEAERSPDSPLLGGYASNQTLNRVARTLSAAHGGQILLSLATTDLVKDSLPAGTELRDMGEHHLRNLIHPEHLFQLNISGLPSDFPPLNTLTPRHNLPLQLTNFIGREKEQVEVIDLLSKNRLVILSGAGGIGKTRLSLQVGQKLLNDFQHGVWFVELAPIFNPLLVPRTTAIAIGLRDEPQRPVIDMLCDYLRDKEMLIILDNCEHLIDACASLADKLLHAASNIKILASSREPLGIPGEVNYRVPSLGLPAVENLPSLESLSQYEAVSLFVDRAKSAVPKFVVTSGNTPALVQICYRLDGIPLAIELAAPKVHVLSVEQIAKRLDDRFRLLTSTDRTPLERHQTLRATIDWSYNLLSPSEQVLFSRLSVFLGGWTLEAAESVCAGELVRSDDVFDLLEQLINKSLVIVEEVQGEARYHMLETLRLYANEKLVEAGEINALQYRHFSYFLDLAEQVDRETNEDEIVKWKDRLSLDDDNFRAALEWCLLEKNTELVLRLLNIWAPKGRHHFSETLSWFDRIRKLPNVLDYPALYAELLNHIGVNSWLRGNDRYGKAVLVESQSIWLSLGVDGELGLAFAYICLGEIMLGIDMDTDAAQAFFEKSFELFQRHGNKSGMNRAMYGLGHKAVAVGDYREAEERFTECVAICKEMRDKFGTAGSLLELGVVAQLQNDYERAYSFHEESLKILRELRGTGVVTATELCNSAWPLLRRRDYLTAKQRLEESFRLSKDDGDSPGMIACLTGFASILGMSGKSEASARLFGAFETLYERSGARPLDVSDRKETDYYLSIVRAQLDEATWTKVWAEGCEMTLEQAITYALEELGN